MVHSQHESLYGKERHKEGLKPEPEAGRSTASCPDAGIGLALAV